MKKDRIMMTGVIVWAIISVIMLAADHPDDMDMIDFVTFKMCALLSFALSVVIGKRINRKYNTLNNNDDDPD